jgi:GNAT superfamily N-acetyltransferase
VERISDNVSLRPANSDDESFLIDLYTSGRTHEFEQVGWNAQQIAAFCRMQYLAQKTHHDLRMPAAQDSIVTRDGLAIGRLKVNEDDEEILLVDIALVPEVQGQKIGTALLESLKQRATKAAKPLRLHVLFTGAGLPLYEKLGFVRLEDDGTYIEMEYRPETVSQ